MEDRCANHGFWRVHYDSVPSKAWRKTTRLSGKVTLSGTSTGQGYWRTNGSTRVYTKDARIQQLVEQLGPRQTDRAARVRCDFAMIFQITIFEGTRPRLREMLSFDICLLCVFAS